MQTSCGFGVPFLTTASTRSEDAEKSTDEIESVLKDRDTMGHWSRNMIEKNALLDWQAKWNSSSLDGCPGMRSAMRDHGDRVWVTLAKARLCRIFVQREALFVGWVLGVVWVLFVQFLWSRFG